MYISFSLLACLLLASSPVHILEKDSPRIRTIPLTLASPSPPLARARSRGSQPFLVSSILGRNERLNGRFFFKRTPFLYGWDI